MYKLFRAIKHQIEKGPVDARVKKAKYTLNDTGLLGDDVEYSVLVRWTDSHTLTNCTRCFEIACGFVPSELHSHVHLCAQTQTHTHTQCSCHSNQQLPPPPPGDFPLLCSIHFLCQCSLLEVTPATHSSIEGKCTAWVKLLILVCRASVASSLSATPQPAPAPCLFG